MKKKTFPFKRVILAYLFAFLPFALISGILSLWRISPAHINGKHYYGVEGLCMSIIFIPLIGMILGAVSWVFLSFGDYIYSQVRNIFGGR